MLYSSYPRLMRPPLNLQKDEVLGTVVEQLFRAMREVRPRTVREFFAPACLHVRWELNDLAAACMNNLSSCAMGRRSIWRTRLAAGALARMPRASGCS